MLRQTRRHMLWLHGSIQLPLLARGLTRRLSRAASTTQDGTAVKEELLNFEGVIIDVLPDGRFRVKLDNEHEIIAYTAGRMKKNRIRTLAGDRVTVEMTPYDLEKGRIVFRHKDARAATTGPSPRARSHFNRRR